MCVCMYVCVRACGKLNDMSKTGPCKWAEMMHDCVYVCVCVCMCVCIYALRVG
jgi:hypothetical protein